MNITFKRLEFLKAYDKLRKSIAQPKVGIPACTCILMVLDPNGVLMMTTTDFVSTTSCCINVTVKDATNPTALINGKLGDLVKAINDEEVVFETNGVNAVLHYKYGDSKINGMDPKLFTVPHMKQPMQKINIKVEEWKALIDNVQFAVSKDSEKPGMMGLNLSISPTAIISTACDGFRSARRAMVYNGSTTANVVIPGDLLNILSDVGSNDEENLEITISQDRILVHNMAARVVCQGQLLDVKFPNVESYYTLQNKVEIVVDRKELVSALSRLHGFCYSKSAVGSDRVQMVIDEPAQMIRLSAKNDDVGEIRDSVPAKVTGTGFVIHFQTARLIEGLEQVKSDYIRWRLLEPLLGSLATSESFDGYTYVAMPIKV